ncbi:MAG: hypothetical protein HIU82_16530 [Proteobacteria bacterium]|nr:hypothetical protein [Pseudomonadota bacterium]
MRTVTPAMDDWIGRVLGLDPGDRTGEGASRANTGTDSTDQPQTMTAPVVAEADETPSLQDWLTDLAAQAALLPEPPRADMLARVSQAGENPDAGAIAQLATAIAQATQAGRQKAAAEEAGNTVTYRLLCTEWEAAEVRARRQLDSFIDMLLGDTDLQADPRYPELQARSAWLEGLLPDDGGTLAVLLRQFDDATAGPARVQAQKKARAALDSYRADLAETEGLPEMQELADDLFGGQPFLSGLLTTLAELGDQLDKRA